MTNSQIHNCRIRGYRFKCWCAFPHHIPGKLCQFMSLPTWLFVFCVNMWYAIRISHLYLNVIWKYFICKTETSSPLIATLFGHKMSIFILILASFLIVLEIQNSQIVTITNEEPIGVLYIPLITYTVHILRIFWTLVFVQKVSLFLVFFHMHCF